MYGGMKPAWVLVAVVGLSGAVALIRDHRATAVVEPEPARALTLGAAQPDPHQQPSPLSPSAAEEPTEQDSAQEPSGEVLESTDVANYTYLRLKTEQGEVWAAVPRATVRVHDRVRITGASLMRDFTSKTLGRTFPSIYFGNLAGTAASAGTGLPADHPPVAAAADDRYRPGTALPPGHPPVGSL